MSLFAKKNKNNISQNLIETIKESGKDFAYGLADISIDEIIKELSKNESILEHIPYIKYFVLGKKIKENIGLLVFIRNYAKFVGVIHDSGDLSYLERKKLKEIIDDENKLEKVAEQTILALDRFKEDIYSKLLGVLFVKTFKEKIFSFEEYNILLFSIDLMHPYLGIRQLCDFYIYQQELDKAIKENNEEEKNKNNIILANLDYSPLANTSLLNLPIGGSYVGVIGGARINKLGKKFYENVIKYCI